MLFLLSTLDKGHIRPFIFDTFILEEGLEAISRIALSCDQLLSVQLQEEGSVLHLPPQAFDGQPISAIIKQLEQQWQEALSRPRAVPLTEEPLITDWRAQQAYLRQSNATFFQTRIDTLYRERLWLQTATLSDAHRASLRSRNEQALLHFWTCLTSAQDQLNKYDLLAEKTNRETIGIPKRRFSNTVESCSLVLQM